MPNNQQLVSNLSLIAGLDSFLSEFLIIDDAAVLAFTEHNKKVIDSIKKHLTDNEIIFAENADSLVINNIAQLEGHIENQARLTDLVKQFVQAASEGEVFLMDVIAKTFPKEFIKDFINSHLPLYIGEEKFTEEEKKRHQDGDSALRIRGITALHAAAEKGQIKAVRWLLEHGAEVNAPTDEGWIPLHAACANFQETVCKLLVRYGGDVHRKVLNPVLQLELSPFDAIAVTATSDAAKTALREELAATAQERENAIKLCEEDKAAVMAGHLLICAATPMDAEMSEDDIEKWSKVGFFIGENWNQDAVHLFIVYLDPQTNEIDIATGYSSPNLPVNFSLFRGQGDALDFDKGDAAFLLFPRLIERDSSYAFDPETRMGHKTTSVIRESNIKERMALKATLEKCRQESRDQLASGSAPMHYTAVHFQTAQMDPAKAQEYLAQPRASCQSMTLRVFNEALGAKMPVPHGIFPTSLNEMDRNLWEIVPSRSYEISRQVPSVANDGATPKTSSAASSGRQVVGTDNVKTESASH